ncbi:MAG: RNA-guided endonuclease InsQ/TnpB family protein [Candidatus Heimdallarchaeota archaeon]
MFMIKNTKRLTKKISKQLVEDLTKEEINKVVKQINTDNKKKLILTIKQKIQPTSEQQEILWVLAENCRLIYNYALDERLKWWIENKNKAVEARKEFPSYTKQQNDLPKIKKQYPRYKQNYSKTLQMTLKELDANFKSFFTLKTKGHTDARPPKYKGKKHFTSLIYNQSGFKIEGNRIALSHSYPDKSHKDNNLRFELHQRIDLEGKKIKQVSVVRDRKTKEFFLTLSFEQEIPIFKDNLIYQAIDQGVITIVSGINNLTGKTTQIKNQRVNKYWQPKINELQSKRDHCKKFSNKWHWYTDKLTKIYKKRNNQQRNFQHKISKKIAENTKANTIIIGDLSVKGMSQKKKGDRKNKKSLHRTLHSTGVISRFSRFLTYKAQKKGKKIIRISEKNTTRRCSYCGEKEYRKLFERVIECEKCGLKIDRDINASTNIMQRFLAIQSLSQKRPLVGQQLRDFRKVVFCDKQLWDTPTSQRPADSQDIKI